MYLDELIYSSLTSGGVEFSALPSKLVITAPFAQDLRKFSATALASSSEIAIAASWADHTVRLSQDTLVMGTSSEEVSLAPNVQSGKTVGRCHSHPNDTHLSFDAAAFSPTDIYNFCTADYVAFHLVVSFPKIYVMLRCQETLPTIKPDLLLDSSGGVDPKVKDAHVKKFDSNQYELAEMFMGAVTEKEKRKNVTGFVIEPSSVAVDATAIPMFRVLLMSKGQPDPGSIQWEQKGPGQLKATSATGYEYFVRIEPGKFHVNWRKLSVQELARKIEKKSRKFHNMVAASNYKFGLYIGKIGVLDHDNTTPIQLDRKKISD